MSVHLRPLGFTESLCLSLAHEWQPGRLLMFPYVAYFDESGTHEGSDTTVMGGLIARADHWKKFDTAFAAIQKRHGFRVFHTKKFKRKDGDFKGWANEQCHRLIGDLAPLTSGYEGITISLNNALYRDVYRQPQVPAKGRFDSKYGLCFRYCLVASIQELARHKYRKKFPKLDVVMERGHKNTGDAERIFDELKTEFAGRGGDLLGSLVLAKKDDCGQLMMADFLAHMSWLTDRKVLAGQHTRASGPVPKGMSGVTHGEFTKAVLEQHRERALNKAIRFLSSAKEEQSS